MMTCQYSIYSLPVPRSPETNVTAWAAIHIVYVKYHLFNETPLLFDYYWLVATVWAKKKYVKRHVVKVPKEWLRVGLESQTKWTKWCIFIEQEMGIWCFNNSKIFFSFHRHHWPGNNITIDIGDWRRRRWATESILGGSDINVRLFILTTTVNEPVWNIIFFMLFNDVFAMDWYYW